MQVVFHMRLFLCMQINLVIVQFTHLLNLYL